MRLLLLITISLFLAACNGSKEEETKKIKEFDNEKYQYLYIPFLNSDIPLPRKFIQVTVDDFVDLQEELSGEENPENRFAHVREYLKSQEANCMTFVDTTDYSSNILILKSPEFMALTKDKAEKLLSLTAQAMNGGIEQYGGKIDEGESTYQKFKSFAVGKHSQRVTYPEFENYRTNYILSGERRTFTILMNTGSKEDIDDVIYYVNLREGEF